jgi:hypothetical protein
MAQLRWRNAGDAPRHRRWVRSLGVLGSAWSQELTKETCITANETGQDLRRDGKLVEARERFELCAVPACPAILREDCAMRLAGLGRAQPTVTFVAKDANDAPIAGLRVRIDGAPAVSGDGAPIPVDPGEHRFELEAKGYAPIAGAALVAGGLYLLFASPSKRRSNGAAFGTVAIGRW